MKDGMNSAPRAKDEPDAKGPVLSTPVWIENLNKILLQAGTIPEKELMDRVAALAEANEILRQLLPLRTPTAARGPSRETRELAEALPLKLKQILDFRPAACAVAVVLARRALPAGAIKVTVNALADAASLSHRSVQRALRCLEDAGLILTESQKIRRCFNEPNLYRLTSLFNFAPPRDDSFNTDSKEINNKESTSYSQQPVSRALKREQSGISVKTQKASNQTNDRSKEKFQEIQTSLDALPDAPADWEALAIRAARILESKASEQNPWLVLDRLRRERLKGFHTHVWQAAASKHAHRALLAVAEVLLRPVNFFHRGPLAYLAGILKKPVNECAPERSVARLLAERSGVASPKSTPNLPLGIKSEIPEDLIHRQIFSAVGAALYRSWFADSIIEASGNQFKIMLRSRWKIEFLENNHAALLRQAGINLAFEA